MLALLLYVPNGVNLHTAQVCAIRTRLLRSATDAAIVHLLVVNQSNGAVDAAAAL